MKERVSSNTKDSAGTQPKIALPADLVVPSEAALKWLLHQCVDAETSPHELGRLLDTSRSSVTWAFQEGESPRAAELRSQVCDTLSKLADAKAAKTQQAAA